MNKIAKIKVKINGDEGVYLTTKELRDLYDQLTMSIHKIINDYHFNDKEKILKIEELNNILNEFVGKKIDSSLKEAIIKRIDNALLI